ncbi:TRAP transporter small permease [Marispirochaeta sp.]|uniref:TRAP transporter small permease n=1 Tax=Marispirochaeta sp. TaxID=2038653 RepID=UPI0029C615D6|nr:TRAP transporter small permease [Marispirochaeta sp.]
MLFFLIIRRIVKCFAVIAGGAILLMMGITVADVLLRLFGTGITGAYDVVRACGAVAVACALPYLTAVKGHIAIEFFYHKCSRLGRLILDSLLRISAIIIFGVVTIQVYRHGLALLASGEVFPNLGLPVFWIPMLISLNFVLMMIVFLYHLTHPGKEFIKP